MPASWRPTWSGCSSEPGRARELGERAVVQARRFSWEATADKALDVLTRSHAPEPTARPRPGRRRAPRRRIAFFSPLPPLRSGVADYSARLLDELKRRYTIDLYHDAGYLPHIGLRSPDFGCYDYRLFERNAGVLDYHAVVYQMGNSHYHGYMYDTLLRHPGIVTLHDLGLAGFHFWYAQQPGVDGEAHIRREFEAFCRGGGRRGPALAAARAERREGCRRPASSGGTYLNGRIFERAAAVIVHSPWCVEQVRSRFPAHLDKMSVVAPGATALDPSPEQRRAIRARFEHAAGGPDHRQPRTAPSHQDECRDHRRLRAAGPRDPRGPAGLRRQGRSTTARPGARPWNWASSTGSGSWDTTRPTSWPTWPRSPISASACGGRRPTARPRRR